MLKLFFDTEFTNFFPTDLIGIGITSLEGFEYYAEVSDYHKDWCSDFVKSTVIPKLQGIGKPYDEVKIDFQIWISNLLADEALAKNGVLFLFDSGSDRDLLNKLFKDFPNKEKVMSQRIDEAFIDHYTSLMGKPSKADMLRIKKASESIQSGYDLYYLNDASSEHHSLSDARALINGWKVASNLIKF